MKIALASPRLCAFAFLASAAAALPVSAQAFVYPLSGWITQGFWTPVNYRASGYHQALDISSYSGGWKLVGAGRRGTVRFAGWNNSYGNMVIINHGSGYETYYGHSYQLIAWTGKWVNTNENIMYEGSTGFSSGPHVHWELLRWGVPNYMPGWAGNWVTRGNYLGQGYAGLDNAWGGGGTTTTTAPARASQQKRIVVGRNKSGNPDVFYLDGNNAINYQYWNGAGWVWGRFGGYAKDLSIVTWPDGREELFYIGTNDVLYHRWQTAPNSGWSGEQVFADVRARSVSAARWGWGAVDVFWVGTGNHIAHKYAAPGKPWSAPLAMPGLAKQIVAETNADGRMQVFYIGTNDALYTNWWTGSGWSGEAALGGYAQQITVGKWGNGRLEMFYIGLTNRRIYHNYQAAPNGGFVGEHDFGGYAKDLTTATWGNGLLELFYVGTNDAIYHNWTNGSAWQGEASLGGYAKDLAAFRWGGGALELFTIGTNNAPYHNWWTGGGWSGEHAF